MRFAKLFSLLLIAATTLAGTARAESIEELSRQVRDSENAFAATMAQRDLKAFESFIAEDAVFFGKAAMRASAIAASRRKEHSSLGSFAG